MHVTLSFTVASFSCIDSSSRFCAYDVAVLIVVTVET